MGGLAEKLHRFILMRFLIIFLTISVAFSFINHFLSIQPKNNCKHQKVFMQSNRANLIVGLNPALQRTIQLSTTNLIPGEVHRASHVNIGVGGKGQNALIASSCMGNGKKFQILQFIGTGSEGNKLLELLGSLLSDENEPVNTAVSQLSIRSSTPCRICSTLVSESSTTEIIEPSGQISEAEISLLLRKVSEIGSVGGLAVMGSMPPGCPETLYSSIASIACDGRSRVLIDSMSGVNQLLRCCLSLGCEYTVLKVNARELCKLTAISAGPLGQPVSPDCLRAAAVALSSKYSELAGDRRTRLHIATTDGPFPAFFYSALSDRSWVIPLPSLPFTIRNPIGAGDAVSAGTINYLCGLVPLEGVQSADDQDRGSDPDPDPDALALAAFRWGLCCGAASCASESNSIFDLITVKTLFPNVQPQTFSPLTII